MEKTSYSRAMAKKSESELIAIVTAHSDLYQQDIVAAAQVEIAARNIDLESRLAKRRQLQDSLDDEFELSIRQVSQGTRFVHYLVDTAVISILYLISTTVAQYILPLLLPRLIFVPLLWYLCIFFLYYIILEGYYQKSLGKMLTGTKVITFEDRKPTMGDIAARTFCRIIPFDNVSFVFSRFGFHDCISRTTVIKDI